MMKKIIVTLMTLILTVGMTSLAGAASSITCMVDTIENGKVLLDCGEKAAKLDTGIKVKVKKVVKRKAVEGC